MAAPQPPALAFPGSAPDVLFQTAEDEDTGALMMPVHVAEMTLCGLAWDALMPYHQSARLESGQSCMSVKREMQTKFLHLKKMNRASPDKRYSKWLPGHCYKVSECFFSKLLGCPERLPVFLPYD